MYDFKTHAELGDAVGEGSGSWGWTHKGREFIAIGQTYGAAFAEVTKKGQLEYLGRLPASNDSVIWREIKKVGDTLIVGSEGAGHGIQFFDMKKLLKLSPKNPKTFDATPGGKDIGWMNITDGIPGRSHNVVANEELGYAVAGSFYHFLIRFEHVLTFFCSRLRWTSRPQRHLCRRPNLH
jgi:hypothetical protein